MNIPIFLARKVRHAPEGSFSATVTRVGVASIALGLAILIVAFGVLFGYKNTIQQKIFLFGAHIQVSKFTNNYSYAESAISLNTKLYQERERIPGFRHMQAVALKAGILKTKEELMGIVLKGVGRDYDWELLRESITAGTVPAVATDSSNGQPSRGSTELLISQYMANQLKVKVGDGLPMYFLGGQSPGSAPRVRKMTVVGIYDTGLEEVDKTIALGDIRLIQRLNNWGPDSVGSYEIFVRDFDQLEPAVASVFDLMSPDLRLTRVTDQYRPLFDWMVLLDRNMVILLALITFVASFNMVSVLLVLMMERTPMIGLLKAIGGPDTLIRRMFLYVGLNMVGWGLLIGNVVGLTLCWLQWQFRLIPLDPKNYFMTYVPISWDWPTILALNGATIALIALVLWLPTLIINRIQPVKALAFKK
ncbi:ABC transporter permease [Spirosoma utsteinense]|uniref:Lipoprotein-releasing system permease protein n=1 Tax=Spirosoma utsteinense TaxID=2585773 RepID=A0ABR6W547_9BACT|nr:FtsX-like permease family protein [Spirosoma utsteinense]MBC3785572.1 lipoprotein-releasing system permease protein [Spirosoma utsteinense]MBC3791720.1 lipoprotein-releasing system permease protein [Spirosoma utsteinense]